MTILNEITRPRNLAIIGLGVGIAAVSAYRAVGAPSILQSPVTTEQAVTVFGLISGIGGAAAQIVASNQLGSLSTDTVNVGTLILPAAISVGATALSAFLLPSA